jgi:hypothetical protein
MNPSKTKDKPQGGQPRKTPQIGRREIGAIVTLHLLNAGRVAPQSTARRPALAGF